MAHLIANRALVYDHKRVAKDQPFETLTDMHAMLLVKAQAARPAVKVEPLPVETIQSDEDEKPKRRYRRRDLQAEEA